MSIGKDFVHWTLENTMVLWVSPKQFDDVGIYFSGKQKKLTKRINGTLKLRIFGIFQMV